MKDRVKLVALDLDDTLLKDDLTISDYTVSVLHSVMDKGIPVVLASGRSPNGMTAYIQRIGVDKRDSFIVCSNGAQIMKSDTLQELRHHCLTAELAVEIFEKINEYGLSCHLYIDDTIYAAKKTVFSDKDSHLTKMKLIIPDDYRTVLRTVPVYKMVIPAEAAVIAAVEAGFKAMLQGRAVVFTSKPYFLEIIPLHSGKGEALLELASIIGIGADGIMAFGDGMNDETMIRLSGYGIAMKNGAAEIQRAAYAVTEHTNNEDGAARFLARYVL